MSFKGAILPDGSTAAETLTALLTTARLARATYPGKRPVASVECTYQGERIRLVMVLQRKRVAET
jgi:hypothetical protein